MADPSPARRVLRGLAAMALWILLGASPAGAVGSELGAAEERGREIYFTGASPSGAASSSAALSSSSGNARSR